MNLYQVGLVCGYRPTHFVLEELVPQAVFEEYKAAGQLSLLWNVFDPRLLWTADRLRGRFGILRVNDWSWGGALQFRGWRPDGCRTGALLSQHRFGRGLDADSTAFPAAEMRRIILDDPWHEDFQFITCLEMDVDWLHFDCRGHDKQGAGILQVRPQKKKEAA